MNTIGLLRKIGSEIGQADERDGVKKDREMKRRLRNGQKTREVNGCAEWDPGHLAA